MINDLFVPIRRVSVRARRLMWIAVACGSAYYLSVLQQSMPLPVLYRGCMVEIAERVVLPANLILFCMGCARFGAFERVRRNPRDEFHLNAFWLVFVSGVVSVAAWGLFVVANMLKEGMNDLGQWSLCTIMLLQLLMMNASVALLVWLLMNLGIAWGQILPPVIAIPIIADFCLKPMPGDLTRYVFYFWYPIGDSLVAVLVQQVAPFIGYCILLTMANVAAFDRSDRLGLS